MKVSHMNCQRKSLSFRVLTTPSNRIFMLFIVSLILKTLLLVSAFVCRSASICWESTHRNEHTKIQLHIANDVAISPFAFRLVYIPNPRCRHRFPGHVPRMHDPHRSHGSRFSCNSVYLPAAQSHHGIDNNRNPLC